MPTTYTKTVNGITYTIVDNGPVLLGVGGHSYTVSVKDSTGKYLLSAQDVNTGVLGTGLLGSGGVVTGSSGYTELLGLGGGTFVTLPGSTGDLSIIVSLLNGNTFWIGGDTTINVLVNALSGQTINVYGGVASFSGNVIASALAGSTINIGYGGTFAGSFGLINLITGSTINFTTGGGTLVVNAGGTLIDISSTTINNYNPKSDTIEFQDTIAPVAKYTIDSSSIVGTSIVTLYGADGSTVGTYTANTANGVTLATGTYYTDGSTTNPLVISYDDKNTYVGACFLAGSMIRTTNGNIAVEDVRIGDEIIAFDWENATDIIRPVVWVGKAHVDVRLNLPDDEAGWPVRVLKDAIADGVPYKDMLLTAEHCLFFKDRFVPVRMLVNGMSIFYDKSIFSYDYYHVETEQQSVITADGMLTESYLDTGNRSSFRQDSKIATLRTTATRSWSNDAAAPLCTDRSFVEPLYHYLETRENQVAGCMEPVARTSLTTHDPDLHLVMRNGAIIRPIRRDGQEYSFMLPSGVDAVRVASRISRPSDDVGPFVDDRRYLGVAVLGVWFMGNKQQRQITTYLNGTAPGGWHNNAGDTTYVWTKGDALLPLAEQTESMMGMLTITAAPAEQYSVEQEQAPVSVMQSA